MDKKSTVTLLKIWFYLKLTWKTFEFAELMSKCSIVKCSLALIFKVFNQEVIMYNYNEWLIEKYQSEALRGVANF